MAGATQADDAGRPWGSRLGRLEQERHQQVGEQEGPDMVDPELELYALGRLGARVNDGARIVDEYVQPVCQLLDLGDRCADGFLGREIQKNDLDPETRVRLSDARCNAVDLIPGPRRQNKQAGLLGRKCAGSRTP